MDTPKPPVTITGSLVQPPSHKNYEATESERKLAALIQLGSHYWAPDFTPAQSRHLLADYLEDLAAFSVTEVEVACRSWRQDAKNKRFPRAAELIQRIREHRVPEQKKLRPQFGGRPIMWWLLPEQIWKPEWRESDIPIEWVSSYQKRKERRHRAS